MIFYRICINCKNEVEITSAVTCSCHICGEYFPEFKKRILKTDGEKRDELKSVLDNYPDMH